MIPTELSELNKIRKKYIIQYLGINTITFFSFSVFYWYENMFPLNYLATLGFIFHLFVLFIPIKLNYNSIKLLIPVYLIFLSLMLYPFNALLWQSGQVTAFIWYFLIPFGIMIIFSFKSVLYWALYILILIVSIFIMPYFNIFQKYIRSFSSYQLSVLNIITILFSLCFVTFIMYYINKVVMIRIINKYDKTKNSITSSTLDESDEKYEILYNNIVDYFESKEPYCDPDFNIAQVASSLNTNISYISKSIRIKRNINFVFFVNTYRITKVKDMINKNYHNKYTLKFIYTSAGFNHQSTFNKVFKLIEGITPSQYISIMNHESGSNK